MHFQLVSEDETILIQVDTAPALHCLPRLHGALLFHVAAEILNGRMAMIGFTLGALTQLRTGQTVWAQLNGAPFAYLAAYGMVVLASLVNE